MYRIKNTHTNTYPFRPTGEQLVMNIPYSAIQFPTYEFFQKLLNKDNKYNLQYSSASDVLSSKYVNESQNF